MSHSDTAPDWHRWVDSGHGRLSRLAALVLISLASAVTLAWPPPSSDTRPQVARLDDLGVSKSYPLRIELPKARPIAIFELAELVHRNDQLELADVGLLPDGTEAQPTHEANSFATAFAGLFGAASAPRTTGKLVPSRIPDLKPGEVLAVDYDLAKLTPVEAPGAAPASGKPRFNAQDGSLTVSKPLLVNGQSRGNATIRIEEGAQIFIATASVADALGDRAGALPSRISNALATRSGFIPFNELRGAGIAVEYDPVKDRVSLSTNS